MTEKLKLTLNSLGDKKSFQDKEEIEKTFEGQDVEFDILLPNNEKHSLKLKNTKEVQDIKVYIENTFGILFTEQEIYFGEKELPNMISLNDIKGIDLKSKNILTVKRKKD